MILKISLRAKASVPKTFLKRKVRLYSLYFPQKTLCSLSLPWNSLICILFLDFVRFAIMLGRYTVKLSKHRKVGLDWYEFLCFGPLCNLRPGMIN